MIETLEEAKAAVYKYVNDTFHIDYEDELIIVDKHTITKDYGRVFIYQSRKFLETDDEYYLVPSGPIIVEKNGSITRLGTRKPSIELIAEFEQRREEQS